MRPLLGTVAYTAFALGIIGTALLAIPVLAGSVGYIVAETLGWNEGMNNTYTQARGYYGVIIVAMVIGTALTLLQLDPVKLLIYAAVLYTLITPPLIIIILHIANDRKLMGVHKNSWISNTLGIITLVVMATAAIMYLFT